MNWPKEILQYILSQSGCNKQFPGASLG